MQNLIELIKTLLNYIFHIKPQQIPSPISQGQSISQPAITSAAAVVVSKMPTINISPRQSNSLSGSAFGRSILSIPPTQEREDIISKEILSCNVPDFMRTFTEITITENNNTIKYYVSPDVLCIGSDDDFLRVPMQAKTARKLADTLDCSMITKKIADQIWKNADLKLNPDPNGPPYDNSMASTERFIFHNTKIETQRAGQKFSLITGHKKDVIYDIALLKNVNNISIYGWFYKTGLTIQGPRPNNTSHQINYCDYSQTIRLISRKVYINDQERDFYDILNSSSLSYLISDEGNYDGSKIYK